MGEREQTEGVGEHDVVRPTVADKHVFGQVVSICINLLVNVAHSHQSDVWRLAVYKPGQDGKYAAQHCRLHGNSTKQVLNFTTA